MRIYISGSGFAALSDLPRLYATWGHPVLFRLDPDPFRAVRTKEQAEAKARFCEENAVQWVCTDNHGCWFEYG